MNSKSKNNSLIYGHEYILTFMAAAGTKMFNGLLMLARGIIFLL